MACTLLLAALPLCTALLAPQTRTHARFRPLRARVNYEVEEGGEARATPLSDDFDGAVQDAANGLLGAIQDGSLKLRLDFDTSMGDETYTKLKLSTEFARDVAIEWALSVEEDENLVLFFPDAGAAALARQEWKMDNLEEAEVPPNVRVKAFPRDRLDADDKAVFALCPRAPERDACEELVNTCEETQRPVRLLRGNYCERPSRHRADAVTWAPPRRWRGNSTPSRRRSDEDNILKFDLHTGRVTEPVLS
jgi:hypothetical protein